MLWEFLKARTVPVCEALPAWFRNASVPYTWIARERWAEHKTSDTLFVIGSGPSVNNLSEAQWQHIGEHDSIGLNFAFLTRRPMTYFYLGYEPSSKDSILKAFSGEVREAYRHTLWFLPTKVLPRLVHPRTISEFFPPEPKLALFDLPPGLTLDSDRAFTREDFEFSLNYRGVMGVGLHLADLMDYKNIVLVGVDLHTFHHFFDEDPVMVEERKIYNAKMAAGGKFESMLPKHSKFRRMDEYYYALDELYFCPRGRKLYIANADNMLAPKLPVYLGFPRLK